MEKGERTVPLKASVSFINCAAVFGIFQVSSLHYYLEKYGRTRAKTS